VIYLATAPDGRIFFNGPEVEQGGLNWVEVGGRTDAAPSMAAVGRPSYIFMACKGLNRNVYVNQVEWGRPFVGWQSGADLQTNLAPALASGADNIAFVAVNLEGRIFYDYAKLGQGGHGWVELDGNGRTNAAPAAALIDDYLFVAVKGTGPNIYVNQGQLGGRFTGWQTGADLQTDLAPALASGADNIAFVAANLEGRIFYDYAKLGQGGHGWVELDGNGRTDGAPAATAIGNYLYVAIKGLDGNIYVNQGWLGKPFRGWKTHKDFQTGVSPAITAASGRLLFWQVRFADDIRPLFRDLDIDSMRVSGLVPIDLNSYDDVKARADDIYRQLAGVGG
jgi:hypothetical protein